MPVQPCPNPGARICRKEPAATVAVLSPYGTWWKFVDPGTHVVYEPVEVIADTFEALCDEMQALRDAGPDFPGACVIWSPVNAGLWRTVERKWVLECVVFLVARHGWLDLFYFREAAAAPVQPRPLMPFRLAVQRGLGWLAGVDEMEN
jgi:hypothetical protein